MNDKYVNALTELAQKQDKLWTVTVVHTAGSSPRKIGSKMIVGPSGELLWGTIGGGVIERKAGAETTKLSGPKLQSYNIGTHDSEDQAAEVGERTGMICGGSMTLYYEPHGDWLRPRVWLFGAGHCGKAVYDLLVRQDWSVVVLDNRKDVLTEVFFPEAERRVGSYDELVRNADFRPSDYVLIMTAGHKWDYDILSECLNHELTYVGMMGSARKVATKFQQLREEGVSEEVIQKINSPIGLNIGGESPEEIAVDIVAKLIQVRYQK